MREEAPPLCIEEAPGSCPPVSAMGHGEPLDEHLERTKGTVKKIPMMFVDSDKRSSIASHRHGLSHAGGRNKEREEQRERA